MDNYDEVCNIDNVTVDKPVENEKVEQVSMVLKIKDNYGINESNLMTAPLFSLKKKKEDKLRREWKKSNGEVVNIEVIGGARYGVPQIAELDVLLALFRIHLKNNDNKIEKNGNELMIAPRINFSYQQLARELGYKVFGGALKKKLEISIKKLNESTIYTEFAIMDASKKEYVSMFNGKESCRILKSFASYTMKNYVREEGQYLDPNSIKDVQYVEIDDFFFKNLCKGYYKLYNYEVYISLTRGVSKRLFLLLNSWSKSSSKFITYQVLSDYIGLDYEDKKDQYYSNSQIKKAMQELIDVGYIEGFEEDKGRGINIIFNRKKLEASTYKNLYKSESEIFNELRYYGLDIKEVGGIFSSFDKDYIGAVLRCLKHKSSKGEVKKNMTNYVMSAFGKTKWDVKEFI